MRLHQIRDEALKFFEWPPGSSQPVVSLQSCLLFTQYMLHKQANRSRLDEDTILQLADEFLSAGSKNCGVVEFARAVEQRRGGPHG